MIGYEQFKNQLIALTGRPDLAVAPYLIKTLATISRSGEFAEDMVAMTLQVYADKFDPIEPPVTGYVYRDDIALPHYYSLRRLLTARLVGDIGNYEWAELTVANSTTLESLERLALRCPANNGHVYMADGSFILYVPAKNTGMAELIAREAELEIDLVLSTSNEKRAWTFCGEETGWEALYNPAVATTGQLHMPAFAEAEEARYIWQMNACLDLVLYGTAASQLRFAGHDKEAQLLYGEFLTGLRQFKADRDNQLVTNEGALGF